MPTRLRAALAPVPALLLFAASAAVAAPPANDARTAPSDLAVPQRLSASLAEATADPADPNPFCGVPPGPSVWYRPAAGLSGRIGIELTTPEGQGTFVAVFRREGGDLARVVCDLSDRGGRAGLFFTADRDERYLVMVGAGVRADAGRFTLETFRPDPPAVLPGPLLPVAGVRSRVDVIRDADDAWSTVMRPGTTYRVAVSSPVACGVGMRVFAPGAGDPDTRRAVVARGCGGYLTLTPGPGEGGRHGILVDANPGARNVRYDLFAAPAGRDDLAPGIPLPERARRSGSVSGRGIDRVDVWGVTVTRRSRIRLRLSTPGRVDLRLYTQAGRLLECACGDAGDLELERAAAPGEYSVIVQAPDGAGGRYRLVRSTRTITTARVTANGSGSATAVAGLPVTVAVRVDPVPAGGTAQVDVDAFDPVAGWLFRRRLGAAVVGGVARMSWTPPTAGRWRLRGSYLGTSTDSPSGAGTARVTVR